MHTIRLRGPWQLEAVQRFVRRADGEFDRGTGALPAQTKATMPADWCESMGPDFLGVVRYRRTFQKPTGLDSGEQVWLLVEPPRSCGRVCLNAETLGCV